MPRRLVGAVFLAPAIVLFIGVFVVPLAFLIGTSFGLPGRPTLAVYERFFGDTYNWRLLLRSLGLGVLVTLLALLFGFPLAYALARLRSRAVPALLLLVSFPLWVSALVRSLAWLVLFTRNGVLSRAVQATGLVAPNFRLMFTLPGVVIALTQVMLPLMVITLYAVLRDIDPDLEHAALNLGASPAVTLALVTGRLARGGIAAGSLLVFSLATSAFATPSLVGGASAQLMSVAIYEQTLELLDWPFAAAMSAILLAVAVAVAFLNARFGGAPVAAHPGA